MSSPPNLEVMEVQGVPQVATAAPNLENKEVQAMKAVEARLEWFLERKIVEAVTEVGKELKSSSYVVKLDGESSSWFLHLYPKGLHDHHSSWVSLFLSSSGALIENASKRMVKFSLAFKNSQEQGRKYKMQFEGLASEFDDGWMGESEFCKIEDLKDAYENNELVIVADLVIPVDDQITYKTEDSAKELFKNMRSMYDFSSFSDLTVSCWDRKYLCHKVILAARSEVFRTMLENKMSEKVENEIEIRDSSPDTVKSMIDYIYSDEIPDNLDSKAEELIHLALKFQLPNLTKACEVALVKNLSVAKALRTLVTVDKYYTPTSSIRKDILKYITINILEVMDTEEWEKFMREYPKLATEVFRFSAAGEGNAVVPPMKKRRS